MTSVAVTTVDGGARGYYRLRADAEGRPGAHVTTLHPFEITVDGASISDDGPHGPAEIAYSEDARRTRVHGPHIPDAQLEDGPGPPDTGSERIARLERGVTGSIGEARLQARLPRYGLSRAARTLELDVAGSRYQLRVRGLLPERLCFERADGTTVARYAIRWSTEDQLAARF